mgnify:CR=1 FL=1
MKKGNNEKDTIIKLFIYLFVVMFSDYLNYRTI